VAPAVRASAHIAQAASSSGKYPSPVTVAGGYAHTAAIRLAALVNSARNLVDGRAPTPHEIRLAREEEQLALRQEHEVGRLIRVAMQDEALHSGDVVQAAYSLRGTRYVMGGTSRSGFDCSGFVRYILSCADGVQLPRTAEEQFYNGTPVSRDQLRPGDLVFFKNTYKRGISHVGIYTGNGKFVHAANPHKGVREDSLDETYYANHYAGARRVVGVFRAQR
jgi:cell wall-associated NlpC family hydrolase